MARKHSFRRFICCKYLLVILLTTNDKVTLANHQTMSHTLSKTERVWCGDHVLINDILILRFVDCAHLFDGHPNCRMCSSDGSNDHKISARDHKTSYSSNFNMRFLYESRYTTVRMTAYLQFAIRQNVVYQISLKISKIGYQNFGSR